MEILQKITDDLEPLGGDMLLDDFIRARRAATAARQAAAAAAAHEAQAARVAAAQAAAATAAQQAPAKPNPADVDLSVPDTNDAAGYMNREAIEGTTDDEVQEFMRERQGFDPTEY